MKNLGTDAYLPLGRSALMKKELVPHENNYLGQGMMNWKGASLVCTLGATWKPFINVDVQNSAFLQWLQYFHETKNQMQEIPSHLKTLEKQLMSLHGKTWSMIQS
jgi:hypothetical protein